MTFVILPYLRHFKIKSVACLSHILKTEGSFIMSMLQPKKRDDDNYDEESENENEADSNQDDSDYGAHVPVDDETSEDEGSSESGAEDADNEFADEDDDVAAGFEIPLLPEIEPYQQLHHVDDVDFNALTTAPDIG
jgi:hypothetical protein